MSNVHVLRPLTSKPRKKKFLVLDFEWYAGKAATHFKKAPYTFRIGYSYDGKRYNFFGENEGVRGFLRYHLQNKFSGCVFFSHWGGIADHIFLIRELYHWVQQNLETRTVKIAMNGSAAMILYAEEWYMPQPKTPSASGDHRELGCKTTVARRPKRKCRRWTFVDSSFLFRVALSKLAIWLEGKKKGGDKKVTFETLNLEDLKEYCRLDCKILYQALDKFQNVVNEKFGATMGVTMASTAIQVIRKKYLKREIHTPREVNEKAALGYVASRVEVYRQWMPLGYGYDLNSSFPYAMTFPLPGSPIRSYHSTQLPARGVLYMAEVEVTVPDTHYLPPLPFRHGGRVFFPTGTWRAWFSSVDIELAQDVGCDVKVVGEIIEFEAITDLADFANDVYGMRDEAKERKSTYEEQSYKLIVNSGYGKFSEGEEKDEFIINPQQTWCETHYTPDFRCRAHRDVECPYCDITCKCMQLHSPGIWRKTRDKGTIREERPLGGPDVYQRKKIRALSHRHVQISMFITSYARRTLYLGQLPNVDYLHMSDTDSMKMSRKIPENWASLTHKTLRPTPVGKALGNWKYEGECRNNIYLGPKLYMGESEEGDPILHAKGFSIGKMVKLFEDTPEERDVHTPENVRRFLEATTGQPINVDHMIRPRSYMRSMSHPYDIHMDKVTHLGKLRPKRCYLDDSYKWVEINFGGESVAYNLAGESRPWTVNEIHQKWVPRTTPDRIMTS